MSFSFVALSLYIQDVKTEKLEGVKKLDASTKFEEENLIQESAAAAPTKTPPRDYTKLYQKAQAQLAEKLGSGGGWRGLELADFQKVRGGRATEEKLKEYGEEVKGPVWIFPFNVHHFLCAVRKAK